MRRLWVGFALALMMWAPVRSALPDAIVGANDKPPDELPNTHFVFIADTLTYDSNIFRLPGSFTDIRTEVAPNASREDHINTTSAGFDAQSTIGRQLITFRSNVDYNRFANNDFLNNVSGALTLLWNWHLGPSLSGDMGAEYYRSLASFAETRVLGKDLIDQHNYYVNGRYQVGPHWALFGGIEYTKDTHSESVAKASDINIKSGHVGVEYALDENKILGWEYRYADGTYPRAPPLVGLAFNEDYKDNTSRLFVKYSLTDKTMFDASAGYLRRTYPDATLGAFSGGIYRLSGQWQATDKTSLVIAGWRELHAYLATESNYFVSKGASITPAWTPTEKLSLSLALSIETEDFIAASPIFIDLGARTDRVKGVQQNITYIPFEALSFVFSYRYEERNSNQAIFNYYDRLARLLVTFKF